MEKKKKKTKIKRSKWRVNKLNRKSGTRHDRKSQTQKNEKLAGKFLTFQPYNPLAMSVQIVLIDLFLSKWNFKLIIVKFDDFKFLCWLLVFFICYYFENWIISMLWVILLFMIWTVKFWAILLKLMQGYYFFGWSFR
jgi:hypothetical protein